MLSIHIHNDGSGTDDNSNYDVYVSVNNSIIYKAYLKGHNRKDGWIQLLRMLIESTEKDGAN